MFAFVDGGSLYRTLDDDLLYSGVRSVPIPSPVQAPTTACWLQGCADIQFGRTKAPGVRHSKQSILAARVNE